MTTQNLTAQETRIKSISHALFDFLDKQLNDGEVDDSLVNERIYIQTALMEFLASDSRRRMSGDEQIEIDRMRVLISELDAKLDEVEEA